MCPKCKYNGNEPFHICRPQSGVQLVDTKSTQKYAIKVPFGKWNEGDWLYVTEMTDTNTVDITPLLYDDYDTALEASKIWGTRAVVVEYPHPTQDQE